MKKKLIIDGMMCAHCQKFVNDTLSKLAGVASVEVSLEDKSAVVELSQEIPDDVLVKVINDAGYKCLSCQSI